MSAPKRHHFVPQMLLENFCSDGKEQVWAYDKWNGNEFELNIRNAALEGYFYTFKEEDFLNMSEENRQEAMSMLPKDIREGKSIYSLEETLATLEGQSKAIIRKIVKEDAISIVTKNEKAILASFLAVQDVRTRAHRDRMKYLDELVLNKAAVVTKRPVPGSKLLNDSEQKFCHMKRVEEAEMAVPYFLNKEWVLFKAPKGSAFYIGDSPLVRDNRTKSGPYANLGLAAKGVSIYLPISKHLLLGMLCPSIGEGFKKVEKELEKYTLYVPPNMRIREKMLKNFRTGLAVELLEGHVTDLNSLQVSFSGRFVYSHHNNFSLVKKMLKDNESNREFLKPIIP